jgi:hypothetical protein
MLLLTRRRVRLHLVDPFPTIEGILVSSWDGHYRLKKPELLEAHDRTQQLEGEAWVPKQRVIFVQRLTG